VADLTLDGIPDLAIARRPRVAVLEGVLGTAFTGAVIIPTNISNDGLAAYDLDRDLRPELIVVSQRRPTSRLSATCRPRRSSCASATRTAATR